MAWTAPRTWVAGETVTAAIMNTHVRDNLLDLGGTAPAWAGWTPSLRTVAGTGAHSVQAGTFKQYGKLVVATLWVRSTGVAAGIWQLNAPVTPKVLVADATIVGTAWRITATSVRIAVEPVWAATGFIQFIDGAASVFLTGAVANGDGIQATLIYEAV